MDWERMDGEGAVRFCRLCKKDVHDVSAMSEEEARAFLSSGEQPCIRYVFDARGEVLFAGRPGLLPRIAAAAALTFGGLVAGGCVGKRACPEPPDRGRGAPVEAAEPVDESAPAEATPEATPADGAVEPVR